MKVLSCVFFIICAVIYAKESDGDQYTTKYDNTDLDAIINNDRLLRAYVDCLLGTKQCSKDGEELKKVLPDALKTACSKCNETQKKGAKKVLHYLIEKKKDWFKELEAIYDPDEFYMRKYAEEAKKEGLDI